MSRTTYERLKAFCETNNISMSQLVENRVNDFLGGDSAPATTPRPSAPSPGPSPSSPGRPMTPSPSAPKPPSEARPVSAMSQSPAPQQQVPMTSAAARYAIDPPPPIIKPKQQENAPAPTEKRPDQIFTF